MAKKNNAPTLDKNKIRPIEIPLDITDEDKVELLDKIIVNQIEIDNQEKKLADIKAEQKEIVKSAQGSIDDLRNNTDSMIKTAREGKIVKEVECIPVKNFETVPAKMEYRDPEHTDIVLHSRPLKQDEFALQMDAEVMGIPPKQAEKVEDDLPV